ncbi:uncharacterized protein RHIMIDRAFT_263133 [Rhizopus microsporus ATCC 52813]|uniref:Uncharacterized protein n=1 Tax=Rhizopus microsporus ATCC 52813 TaxID=1340429 RepID=A0A2G4SLA9_RHIZD|nr:uncharacterized protein RHIMIDRAFT_263133 [Rhizopus microsporus ATCC 52813]PHZ09549.1 hypothetical protein RHIMIDRAFT_263133 [Rhizopus microsporus ATCC 52813]
MRSPRMISDLPMQQVLINPMKTKNLSTIGVLSIVALLHSHIYWFYSIIYIVYSKMSVQDHERPRRLRLKRQKKSIHSTKPQDTSSSTIKTTNHIDNTSIDIKSSSIDNNATTHLNDNNIMTKQSRRQNIPLLHAVRSFPTRFQQKIQLKKRKRAHSSPCSTSIEADQAGSDTAKPLTRTNSERKRGRAMTLLRATFRSSSFHK